MNDKLEEALGNAKVVFGLKNQGHIPTIEKMLAEGKQWDDIGLAIHWCPITAREHYERYLHSQDSAPPGGESRLLLVNNVCPLLAAAVEMLRGFGNRPDTPVWDQNNISTLIFKAEKHLRSTSSKIHPILKPNQEST